MTTDGLSLEQVQQQWSESQKLIDELRIRLETLASASTHAAEAASSAEASHTALTALADAQQQTVAAFEQLQAQATDAVESLRVASANNDTSRLMHEVTSVGDTVGKVAQSNASVEAKVAAISTRLDGVAKDLTAALARQDQHIANLTTEVAGLRHAAEQAADAGTRLQQLAKERDQAQQDLRKAVAVVPGRYASKISDAIGRPV